MKALVITVLISIATLISGLYLGARYIGEGEVVVALCVMGDVAIKENYLSKRDFLSLSEKTGRKLKDKYPLLAKNLELSDAAVNMASEHSTCSQILVALTNGIIHEDESIKLKTTDSQGAE